MATLPSYQDDMQAVRLLDQVLEAAVAQRASDLHFEPYSQTYRIRFRIDGVLHEHQQLALALKERLTARLKVLAQLDIAERRIPQDGRMAYTCSNGTVVDLRVSTLPTLFGEKIAVRILESPQHLLTLQQLGYHKKDLQLLLQAIERPQGMVLVTGPTGSGKTQTLYGCLRHLNQTHRHIASVEDPCEIPLTGINQVHVNDKAGLDFASVLRAFLRQDPDVLMVGEIRDATTADIALKAAQTGHLVLSTLHTNTALAAITRLRHMGIAPWQLVASLQLLTAQRLVRTLCPQCKREVRPDAAQQHVAESLSLEGGTLYEAVGCAHCHGGYLGRTGIYQIARMTSELQQLVIEEAPMVALETCARQQGMASLREAGWHLAWTGATSWQEIMAITDG